MKTIWKFPVSLSPFQVLSVPHGAEVLSAQLQHGGITLWAIVDDELPREQMAVQIIGTGHGLQHPMRPFIGTVQAGEYVWHVFAGGQP